MSFSLWLCEKRETRENFRIDRAAFPVPLLSHFSLLPLSVLIQPIFWERELRGRGKEGGIEKKEKGTRENGREATTRYEEWESIKETYI